MNASKLLPSSSVLVLLLLAACTNASSAPLTPSTPAPGDGTDDQGQTATTREALAFVAPCSAQTCGAVPASSKASKPECTSTAGTCAWTDPSPDGSVSFRECSANECGTSPDASVCPSGTSYKGSTCGSENEGPCVWRSACVPPPSTTACGAADGCGPKPELGVICKDGTTGDLLCMQQGAKCGWQRSCE